MVINSPWIPHFPRNVISLWILQVYIFYICIKHVPKYWTHIYHLQASLFCNIILLLIFCYNNLLLVFKSWSQRRLQKTRSGWCGFWKTKQNKHDCSKIQWGLKNSIRSGKRLGDHAPCQNTLSARACGEERGSKEIKVTELKGPDI